MKTTMHGNHNQMMTDRRSDHYRNLLIMAVLSYISMYVLMYAMVNTLDNVIPNLNQFYMAGLMTSPMIIIEIVLMRSMYTNKKLNYSIIAIRSIVLIALFLFIRQQTAVSDRQFLNSMIPHHASAILMCEKSNIQDPEIKVLCASIISGQQEEINQMKAKLVELEK